MSAYRIWSLINPCLRFRLIVRFNRIKDVEDCSREKKCITSASDRRRSDPIPVGYTSKEIRLQDLISLLVVTYISEND